MAKKKNPRKGKGISKPNLDCSKRAKRSSIDPKKEFFLWSYEYFDKTWPCSKASNKVPLGKVLDRKKSIEQLAHRPDFRAKLGATKSHFVPLHKLIKDARKRLEDLGYDYGVLLSIRVDGEKRLWCLKQAKFFLFYGGILNIRFAQVLKRILKQSL